MRLDHRLPVAPLNRLAARRWALPWLLPSWRQRSQLSALANRDFGSGTVGLVTGAWFAAGRLQFAGDAAASIGAAETLFIAVARTIGCHMDAPRSRPAA